MTKSNNILATVGNTPLIRISSKIYAKLETTNPSGSIKDRMVLYLIEDAEKHGGLKEGIKIVEASSGNTGISLAMIGAAKGYDVTIIMPCNMSEERKQMIRIYGANIIEVGPNEFLHAISMRDEMLEKDSRSWSPRQFTNALNIECHHRTTAPEIYRQRPLRFEMEAFIHGGGTGGTMMGVKQFFDEFSWPSKVPQYVLVTPAESALTHGIQGINDGRDFFIERDGMDDIIEIKTQDAIDRARRLAREMGLMVGISSGANVLAAEQWVEEHSPVGYVMTMLSDRGERYLSIY